MTTQCSGHSQCLLSWLDWDFPGGSVGKKSAFNSGGLGSVPESGRSPEKEMATHFIILAWRTLWTEELGVLLSTGSQRVGYNWTTYHSVWQTHLNWSSRQSQDEQEHWAGGRTYHNLHGNNSLFSFFTFFLKNIIFNWRMWINHKYTYILSLLNFSLTSPHHPTPLGS